MTSNHANLIYVAVSAAILLFYNPAAAQPTEQSVRVAALACQANLDSFKSYKCRFTVIKAEASTLAKALRGEYENVRRHECLLVVDGDKEKLETLDKSIQKIKLPEPKKGQKGPVGISVDWVNFGYISNGLGEFEYSPDLETATLRGHQMRTQTTATVPLSMGYMGYRLSLSPGNLLKACDEGSSKIVPGGEKLIDGQPVVDVTYIPVDNPDHIQRTFSLNVQRGYLPQQFIARMEKKDFQGIWYRSYLLEAKQCSHDRWFPMHSLRVIFPDKSPVGVIDIRVTELDVDNHTSDKDFELVIPAGTSVIGNESNVLAGFQLRKQENLTPNDLPRLFEMYEDSKHVRRMDTAVKIPGWSWKVYVNICLTAVLLLFVGVFVWQRRVRSSV